MLYFTNRGNYYTSSLLSDLGYVHGFGTRFSPFIAHIFPTLPTHFMKQVHGAACSRVESPYTETLLSIDGQYTSMQNNVLVVKTADCVPVLYVDPKRSVIAASHQGWKGSYHNMAKHMIEKLVEEGSDVKDIRVAIGPHISSCCYFIAPDVMQQFGYRLEMYKEAYSKWYDTFIEKRGDNYGINLLQLNMLQLQDMGITSEHIDYGLYCTSCLNDTFYSHVKGDTSVQYSFIMQ